MKKSKRITLAIVLIIAMTIFSVPVFSNVAIGYTTISNIVTYINNYPIRSFNINGDTAIVAEDLKFYGFGVSYDYTTRILSIEYGPMIQIHPQADTGKTANGEPIVRYQYNLGTKLYDIYQTDIKTYINGEQIQGFNINGQTAIYASELARFGDISYNDIERNLYITLNGKTIRPSLYPVKVETIFDLDTAIIYLKEYWKNNNMYVFSLNLTGHEVLQKDYLGKYYEIRCKSWLSSEHIFKVYESGYVTY